MQPATYRKLDWVLIGTYLFLVLFGWMNIYSSSSMDSGSLLDFKTKYGMHLIWIASSFLIATLIITVISPKLYSSISWPFYFVMALLLLAVAFVGVEVNGSKSWFEIGPIRFQPAEFSKISTSLLLAYIMSKHDFSFKSKRDVIKVVLVLLIPMVFILLEKETGSALVYMGFLLVFFREGMSGWVLGLGAICILLFIITLLLPTLTTMLIFIGILAAIWAFYAKHNGVLVLFFAGLLILLLAFAPRLYEALSDGSMFIAKYPVEIWVAAITIPLALFFAIRAYMRGNKTIRNVMAGYILGVAMIFSVQFIFDNILQDHQRARIEVLLGIRDDPMGVGYNVHQSLIAIGSGGLFGKGYLNGTQTRFNFVPEQSTDFIFCTVGEEWGFIGAIVVLAAYLVMLIRLINSAEKQNDRFTRIYGYCVASCLFMHVLINISMTIGLMPVIGIPLPFLSYGGSSLWTFTILLFIYIRMDLEKRKYK